MRMFNTQQYQMIEAILSHGASGQFSVFESFDLGNWMKQSDFRKNIYTEITQTIFFFFLHFLSPLQSITKTICKFWKYFGRILFANTDLQIFSFKFKGEGGGCYLSWIIIKLLLNITEHYFLFQYFFFFLQIIDKIINQADISKNLKSSLNKSC